MQIQGKTVLVTGASSGIGEAIARAMARQGARVLLLARRQSELDRVAAEIAAAGGEARGYPVDLTDLEAIARVAEAIKAEVGVPDIIVNNAGAGRFLFVEETTPAEAVQMMAVPYFAAFAVTRAFLPEMLARNSGHIVNITSGVAHVACRGMAGYAVARWAMRGFAEALRAETFGTKVRVTLVTPGTVRSPYFETNPGSRERIPAIDKFFPALTPEQVADAVVWGVERNKRHVITPWLFALAIRAHRVMPWPIEWLVLKTGPRRPKQLRQRPQPEPQEQPQGQREAQAQVAAGERSGGGPGD